MASTFTVYFEDPFWVGVLETSAPDGVHAARHVFGAEPTGPELLHFATRSFDRLLDRALASPPATDESATRQHRPNPKRAARLAAREQTRRPVSTAAQEALSQAFELNKKESRQTSREQRDADRARRREIARTKAKAKHRGH